MPAYQNIDLQYAPLGPGKVWVDSRDSFRPNSLGKTTAPDTDRQQHFHAQLARLAEHLGSRTVPVFIHWPQAGRKRMDKGCIGHAVASGYIAELITDADGYVSHVRVRS